MRHVGCVFVFVFVAASARAQDGAGLYAQHCGQCHDAGLPRIPTRRVLSELAPERILSALETGTMRTQGGQRTADERRAVAAFLTGKSVGETPAPPPLKLCSPKPPAASDAQWTGWGVTLTNDRFQRDGAAKLTAADIPQLKVKWAFGFPGDSAAAVQPSIFGGRVFVASVPGRVYALDLKEGCVYWTFDAEARVRTAVEVGEAGGIQAAFFGDVRGTVYSVNAVTGQLRWRQHVDDHPLAGITGTPKLYEGRLYVPVSSAEEFVAADPKYPCCTFRGSVVALDAANGEVAWKTYILDPPKPTRMSKAGVQLYGPSGAAVWSSPTVDEKTKTLYIGTGDNYSDPPASTSDAIVALDLSTGTIKWSQQMTANDAFNVGCFSPDSANCPEAKGPDVDFGSPPILVTLASGKRALVIGQKSAVVHALDPDDKGHVLWSTRIGRGGPLGGVEWGSAADSTNIYAPLSDIALKPGGPEVGNALTADPAVGGGVFALRLTDGKEAWHAKPPDCTGRPKCSPAQSAPPALINGVVFSGSIDGHLRAYSTQDGHIVWDFNTAQEFSTVNGVKAHGGSIDVGGPAIADGILLTTSGYSQWGGMSGNVLLAFSVGGK